jgi:diketogulonate reductase-like aldo/keto reductase
MATASTTRRWWHSWRTQPDARAAQSQLALAWVAATGEDVVPVVGAQRVEQVTTMLEHVTLSAEEITELAALIPRGAVAGERYPAAAMADLDSERHQKPAPAGT